MTIAHLYGQDAFGDWRPMLVTGLGGAPAGSPGAGTSGGTTGWSYAAAAGGITDTSDVTLAAAAGVGKSNYITSIQVCNSSATATEVVIKDGSTVIWRQSFGASMIAPVHVALNLASSANTALKVACITTSTKTYIDAQGYVDASPSARLAAVTPLEELFDEFGNVMFDNSSSNNQLYTQ